MKRDLDAAILRLDDYVRGHELFGDDAAARDFEDELFARALADDAPELAFRDGLGQTLRVMNGRGSIEVWLTARDVERVLSTGVRALVREVDFANPNRSIPDDIDLLITRFPLDLEGVRRMEAEILAPDGQLLKTMPDIAFDRADGAIYACCEADLARTAASSRATARLWAIDDAGRRLLGEVVLG